MGYILVGIHTDEFDRGYVNKFIDSESKIKITKLSGYFFKANKFMVLDTLSLKILDLTLSDIIDNNIVIEYLNIDYSSFNGYINIFGYDRILNDSRNYRWIPVLVNEKLVDYSSSSNNFSSLDLIDYDNSIAFNIDVNNKAIRLLVGNTVIKTFGNYKKHFYNSLYCHSIDIFNDFNTVNVDGYSVFLDSICVVKELRDRTLIVPNSFNCFLFVAHLDSEKLEIVMPKELCNTYFKIEAEKINQLKIYIHKESKTSLLADLAKLLMTYYLILVDTQITYMQMRRLQNTFGKTTEISLYTRDELLRLLNLIGSDIVYYYG